MKGHKTLNKLKEEHRRLKESKKGLEIQLRKDTE